MANFAIMGFGTVGKGVAEVLCMNGPSIAGKIGEPLNLKYILHRRDLSDSPYADLIVKDFAVLENDPDLDVIVECIGGVSAALDYTRRALRAGKHVVTSNKEVVAAHGKELLALAREHNVNYLFEASVGGGIPVLRPLFQCLAGNQIEEIAGILNGTTNYILTRMVVGGVSFKDALSEAQEKGYAEADPTADVEGLDACRKICILSDLAWGKEVAPGLVSTQGISAIDLQDVAIAGGAGYRIKLLGRAMKLADGRQAAWVAPHLVPVSCPIATVDDVFNAIMIRSNAAGDTMFYGRGAGSLPTASAVMGDVIDVLNHRNNRRDIDWSEPAQLADMETEVSLYWYLRGDFEAPADSEKLAEGACIVGPACRRDAKDLADKLGAQILLPVLR